MPFQSDTDTRTRTVLLGTGLLAVLAVGALVGLVCLLAVQLDVGAGGPNGVTRLSVDISLIGTVIGAMLFGALVAFGLADMRRSGRTSSIYPPIVSLAGFLLAVTMLGSASGIYLIRHHFRQGWPVIAEPEVRVFINLLYLGAFGSLAWFLGVMLRGRGVSTRALILTFGAIGLATAVVIAAISL